MITERQHDRGSAESGKPREIVGQVEGEHGKNRDETVSRAEQQSMVVRAEQKSMIVHTGQDSRPRSESQDRHSGNSGAESPTTSRDSGNKPGTRRSSKDIQVTSRVAYISDSFMKGLVKTPEIREIIRVRGDEIRTCAGGSAREILGTQDDWGIDNIGIQIIVFECRIKRHR